jgi:hypothetical protein
LLNVFHFSIFRLRHEQRKELRSENSPVSENDFEKIKNEILQNLSTAFAEPELYPGLSFLVKWFHDFYDWTFLLYR